MKSDQSHIANTLASQVAVGDTLEIIWDTCGGIDNVVNSCNMKWRASNDRPHVIKVNTSL